MPDVAPGHLGTEQRLGRLQLLAEVPDRPGREGRADRYVGAVAGRHHALVGVLVGLARPEQVAHQPGPVGPPGDLGYHGPGRLPRAARLASSAAVPRSSASVSAPSSAGTRPVALATRANWFRLLAAPATVRRAASRVR